MKLDGSAVLSGDPEKVWSVITDPAVLARTIPGCETLEQVGDDEYKMNVSVGVGAIRGTYAGEVKLSDKQHPTSYVMHASGAGAPGNARAQVTIKLEPAGDGKTNLTYSADAVIGGPVAGVGQRMITGVAKRMAGQFFTAIDDELTGKVVPIAAAPSAAAAAPSDASLLAGGAPADAAGPQVFAGKAAPSAPSGDAQTLLLGAVGGAVLTLIGVLVGYRLGRRS
ncbi:carbon monoxide dehydrogenase subunit G [Blastococcus brunescens]|uniref:Carbon monoxide dehydrogenase subunit G n=1 Tax=Blastococcus brunescens TaxID=1564165 RepID=A0ABZ1AZQ9_9ACTN|nr:carbon monoxide dehydrogenase subunit G [Blastococcus sp. BMG 8361]WRL63974.1 carbon monoxide dehydrogenase subunit G [Blastococcus sp. BMG 8361]